MKGLRCGGGGAAAAEDNSGGEEEGKKTTLAAILATGERVQLKNGVGFMLALHPPDAVCALPHSN